MKMKAILFWSKWTSLGNPQSYLKMDVNVSTAECWSCQVSRQQLIHVWEEAKDRFFVNDIQGEYKKYDQYAFAIMIQRSKFLMALKKKNLAVLFFHILTYFVYLVWISNKHVSFKHPPHLPATFAAEDCEGADF